MGRRRRGKRRRAPDSDWLATYLITGIRPPDDIPGVNEFEIWETVHDGPVRRAAWERLRGEIMANWNRPGCRPWAWWRYDAPRLPLGTFPGCYWDGKLPEPRRHLGGPGMPLHERLRYVPDQSFGIWQWFGDPDDPPVFESQFEYLKRHGLLLPGEDEPLPEPEPHPERIQDAAKWDAGQQAQIQANKEITPND